MGRSATPDVLGRTGLRPMRAPGAWAFALLAGALAASGCDAPLDAGPAEVSLRDVLGMSPESVRALPLETRLHLRERFEEAMLEQRAVERVSDDATRPTPEVVRSFDALRAEHGDDALVLLAVERVISDESPGATAELRTLVVVTSDAGVELAAPVSFVVEDDAHLFDEAMTRAIDGPARPWLERMASDRGVAVLVPAPLAPAAVLGDDAQLHVSPTWLALLSTIDEDDVATGSAALLYGPLGHHSTASTGFGCYNSCDCDWGCFGTASSCTCNYCGMDWGLCATECGNSGEGCHCRAPHPPRRSGSPLDPVWIALPAAYLLLRRRPR